MRAPLNAIDTKSYFGYDYGQIRPVPLLRTFSQFDIAGAAVHSRVITPRADSCTCRTSQPEKRIHHVDYGNTS